MTAPGLEKAQQLLDGGFSPTEVADWQANQKKMLLEGGFSQAEADTHFGTPPFTVEPITKMFHDNLQATISAAAEPTAVKSFSDAVEAGLQMSVAGLATRGQGPSKVVAPDTDWMDRTVANVTTLAADLPVMGAGALIGGAGGPVTAMGGAMGLPAGMRKILMDKYANGEVQNFGDFWTRLSGAVVDTAKGWVTGAATSLAGKFAGAAPIASPTAKSAAVIGSEITTMVTMGKALEGEVPSAQDFTDAALALGFIKAGMHGAKAADAGVARLREIYARTGVRPDHLAQDLTRDVTIQQDLLSENIPVPKAYGPPSPITERTFQRYEEPGVEPGAPDKPHGLYVSPAGVKTPHADLGGTRTLWELKPDAKVLHIDEYPGSAVAIRRDAIGAGAGVHAAKQLLGDTVFEQLRSGTKADAIAFAEEKYPGPDYTRYYDKQEVIEAIGAQEARKQGYDAINMPDTSPAKSFVGDFSEAVLLNPKAASQVPPGGPPPPSSGGHPPKTPPPPKPPQAGSLDDAHDTIRSKVSVGAAEPTEKLTFQKFYTAVIDDLNPIREAVKQAQKESVKGPDAPPLPTKDDPYQLGRLTRGTYGKADVFLEHETYDFKTYQATGEALKTILDPVSKDLDHFRNYTVAKRALELAAREIDAGVDLDAAARVVKAHDKTYAPVMRKLVDYQNRVSKYLLDAGVVSPETYAKMLEANKDYVPFFRVMDDGAMGGPWLGGGLTTKNPIKAIKGSDRVIVDPLESVIKNTYTYIALAERNAVGQKFVEMANKSKDPSAFIQKVKPDLMPVTLTETEIQQMFDEFLTIRKQTTTARTESTTSTGGAGGPSAAPSKAAVLMEAKLQEALAARGYHKGEAEQIINRVVSAKSGQAGATIEKVVKEIETTTYVPELDIRLPNDVATVFRTVKRPLADNEIAVFTNGKRTVYEVDPDVATAFKSADQETTNLLMKILRVPASTLRAGAVLAPEFIARNALRDQLSALVLSRNDFMPVMDFMRGMVSLGTKDEHFVNWLKGGGANSTLVSMDRQYLQENLFKLSQDTGLMSRAINVAKSPLEMLRVASELVENATRIGEFRKAIGTGTTKGDIQHAAFESREVTLDFARIGAKARAVNMISAFFNAQIQGVDRIARAFADNPIGTAAKLGGSITLPSVLLWWANRDDPRYQELPQWQKDLFWIVMTKDTIYRIPKPFEAGIVFGSVPERLLDKYVADNPEAMRNLTQTILDAFTPTLVPTFAAPMVEQFSNKSLFTGNPVIPTRMEKLMPEYQYTEYTTETTKALGALIGAFPGMTPLAMDEHNRGTFIGGTARALTTPVLIDNYLRSWTGGLGQHVLNLVDAGLRKAHVVPDPILPAKTLADIPLVKAFIVRYPSASAESIQRFYDDYYTKEKVHNTFMAGAKSGDPAMMDRAMTFDQTAIGNRAGAVRDVLTQQGSVIRGIVKNPNIPAEEKRQLIDQTYVTMIQLAREGRIILEAGKERP